MTTINRKLKYKKVNNSNLVISVDLLNGYSVIAVSGYHPDTSSYITSLFLKNNTVDEWKLCEKAELLQFFVTEKMLNLEILKQISDFLEEGFFDYYIERYEKEMAWRDMGFNMYLKEVN